MIPGRAGWHESSGGEAAESGRAFELIRHP
jgi:hypothetical protein